MSLKTVVRLKLHKDRKNIKNSESSHNLSRLVLTKLQIASVNLPIFNILRVCITLLSTNFR